MDRKIKKMVTGFRGDHLPLDYYDIHLKPHARLDLDVEEDASITLFTLLGKAIIQGERVAEKTAVKLTEGTRLTISADEENAQVLFIKSRALNEEVAWAGPIVMNTHEELKKAFDELRAGTFIKERSQYL